MNELKQAAMNRSLHGAFVQWRDRAGQGRTRFDAFSAGFRLSQNGMREARVTSFDRGVAFAEARAAKGGPLMDKGRVAETLEVMRENARRLEGDFLSPRERSFAMLYGTGAVHKRQKVNTEATDRYWLAPTRKLVHEILMDPLAHGRKWSIQGFGMLRTYFGTDNQYRLNIWASRFRVPNVSIIHDHPWDFDSWIVWGNFSNVRYSEVERASAPLFLAQTIKTGEGGGPVDMPRKVRLAMFAPEFMQAGDHYSQKASEIHASFPDELTVTLNDRRRIGDGEHARVFWPYAKEWVDAEPRKATDEEVLTTTLDVLRKHMGEG